MRVGDAVTVLRELPASELPGVVTAVGSRTFRAAYTVSGTTCEKPFLLSTGIEATRQGECIRDRVVI